MREMIIVKYPDAPGAKCSACQWKFHFPEEEVLRLPTLNEMIDRYKRIRLESFNCHRCSDFGGKKA
jgi:hypothetical protein